LKVQVFVPGSGDIRGILVRFLVSEENIKIKDLILLEDKGMLLIKESVISIKQFPNLSKVIFQYVFELIDVEPTDKTDWKPIISEKFSVNNWRMSNGRYSFRFWTKKNEDPCRYFYEDRISKINDNPIENSGLVFKSTPTFEELFWLMMGNLILSKMSE
jgi:hypothetical protein